MNFGLAIEALKSGKNVARTGWNGKDSYLFLVKGGDLSESFDDCEDSIALKTAHDTVVIGWIPRQTDILAEDWYLYSK